MILPICVLSYNSFVDSSRESYQKTFNKAILTVFRTTEVNLLPDRMIDPTFLNFGDCQRTSLFYYDGLPREQIIFMRQIVSIQFPDRDLNQLVVAMQSTIIREIVL